MTAAEEAGLDDEAGLCGALDEPCDVVGSEADWLLADCFEDRE